MTRAFPFAIAAVALASPLASADDHPSFERDVRPVLEKTCLGCHGARRPKGGIDLSKYPDGASARREPDLWERVADAISDGSMPPSGKPAPSDDERERAAEAIEAALAVEDGVRDPGPGPAQRLTRSQYNNTLRDLLGVDARPADAFPADGAGGEGFANNASTLFVSPIWMERHLAAVSKVIDQADPSAWKVATPGDGVSKEEAARRCIARFASRAFRRPPTDAEVDRLMGLFRRADARADDFDAAVKLALRGALASPRFLFLSEEAKGQSEPYRVSDYELASRLSYFLWSSCPDDTLYDLAKAGKLHEPEVLDGQVRRMLADPKSRAFAEDFAGQWLGIDRLATVAEPDRRQFPVYTDALRDAMSEEAIAFFQALMRDDAPVLDLLDSDYAYLNQPLAEHYGIPGVEGAEFRRVALTDRSRGGVLGMGAVLTLTSYPRRTSPVLRGKWVLEEILGTPPPPPPPNVKVLPADDRAREGLTFRQRLEQHRADPKCATCHAKLDPLGFGLEEFDPVGRLRDKVGGEPVDASGVLAGGVEFRGSAALKKILREDQDKKDLFVRNLSGKMLSYALRRGLEYYDAPTVKEIAAGLEDDDYRAQSLVIAIVRSVPFQYRRDTPPNASPTPTPTPRAEP